MYIGIIVLFVIYCISSGLKPNYVEKDMQSMFNRPDLRCPMKCNRYPAENQMHCCICRSKSDVDDVGNLTIEYKDGQYNSEKVICSNHTCRYTHVYHLLTDKLNSCIFIKLITGVYNLCRSYNIFFVHVYLIEHEISPNYKKRK